jgi:two-component system, sensor histidine kinase and response regulator
MRVERKRSLGVSKVITSEQTCPDELLHSVGDRQFLVLKAPDANFLPLCAQDNQPEVAWHVYFPLRASGHVSGLMCLYAFHDDPPENDHLQLISELCLPVALAIENTRLYEEARRHGRQLELRVEERTRELSESTAFWQALIDHVPSPIFYKDTELLFLGCNQAYEQVFGVSRSDIVGKKVLDLDFLPAGDRQQFQQEQERVMVEGGTLHHEIELPHADGDFHQMLYSATSFHRSDGKPGGIVGVLVDITEQKQAEAKLAAARDVAESADRVKSAFLATMSHELRTPLNSIIGFTGILLQELAGPLNEEQSKQLGMVRNSARHLLALINDVLDISKIEAGELTIATESFDLRGSLHKIVEIAKPLADKKGLKLMEQFDDQLGQIRGDSRRLEQVVLNLISNAIKFTSEGSVSISATITQGDANRPEASICVTDTGVGIRESDLEDLFVPFRQIDSRLSREHEGTGLGLAICKRLTEMMGGRITVDSQYGQGSQFSIALPLQTQEERKAS